MTYQDVFDTLNEEQKETFYYLVDWAINNNNVPFLVRNYRNGDESQSYHHRKWSVFKTFNDNQKKLTSLIIDEVLEEK